PRPAAAKAEAAAAILDPTLAVQTQPLNNACAKGCNHCCHCLVVATPPEIFRIANWLSQRIGNEDGGMVAKVHSEASRRRPMSAQDRFQDSALCAMDAGGACGVYHVRPLPCRALLSLSAEACRLGIMEGRGQIPLVTGAMDSAEIVRTLMLAAVRSLGLSDAGYELTAGVSLALTAPDSEQRWLAGEDVFAGAPRGPRPPQARALEDRIAMQIQSLVD
ncbi:MAG: YkgJ family cysteine cluster protein, partial [Hyphomicrobiaceae bacterium]